MTSKGRAAAGPASLPRALGSYEIVDCIGQGGMGCVYLAWHKRLKRYVAIKVLPSLTAGDAPAIERFQREMEAVGRLDHPHVIRATDAGEADGVHFLVMDYHEGVDLARLVAAIGPLPAADACEVGRQAALGLECIAQHGLVHRDIKPSNLLLTSEGVVKILDLGVARLRAAGSELTASGFAVGTLDYIAPEQASGSSQIDIRADIYSLGCTLYALLAGRAPFSGPRYETAARKLAAHCSEPPQPLDEIVPDIPLLLSDVVTLMLAKSPADRPSTPTELAAALEPMCPGSELKALVGRGLLLQPTRAALPPSTPHVVSSDLVDTARGEEAKQAEEHEPAREDQQRALRKRLFVGASLMTTVFAAAIGAVFVVDRFYPSGSSGDGGAAGKNGRPLSLPPQPVEAKPKASEINDGQSINLALLPNLDQKLVGELEIDANGWQNLLSRRPALRTQPRSPGNSRLDYDAKKKELDVVSLRTYVVELGATELTDFTIRMRISQVQWGGFGVFVGGNPDAERPENVVFWSVNFGPAGWDKIEKKEVVVVTLDNVMLDKFGDAPDTASTIIGKGDVPRDSQILQIVVANSRLRSVKWGQQVFDKIAKEPLVTTKGSFGILVGRSQATFSDCRLKDARVQASNP